MVNGVGASEGLRVLVLMSKVVQQRMEMTCTMSMFDEMTDCVLLFLMLMFMNCIYVFYQEHFHAMGFISSHFVL